MFSFFSGFFAFCSFIVSSGVKCLVVRDCGDKVPHTHVNPTNILYHGLSTRD
jgi:hypothetical protein